MIGLAGNRQMAVGIKNLKFSVATNSINTATLSSLSQKAIAAAYGSKVSELQFDPNSPLESPENLYQIGRLEIDDLFQMDVSVKGSFEIPNASGVTKSENETPTELTDNYAEVSGTIFNGANLRAVNIFTFKVPLNPSASFENNFLEKFKKAVVQAFPNPNIYPKSDPKHFADLLFTYSESKEQDMSAPLTCENASERLKFYAAAKDLFEIAEKRGSAQVVGTQGASHQLTSRLSESTLKAKIVEDCIVDQSKTFEIQIDYTSIVPTNQVYIQRAMEAAKFEPVLKQYTSKPVKFRFQVEANGKISLFVDLRFDGEKYKAWTIGRIPMRLNNFQILSLDPYFALMQKLILFRGSLGPDAPFALKTAFENMRMMLNLKTLINGEAAFAVDGKIAKDQKHLSMAYPNSIFISAPGFETKQITAHDSNIFQEKAWITLGNCKTIEGTKTEDGLVYDFFNFPCQ
ncbi:MAG: hypothetical protein JWQ35_905 [Bacteriovoracaceae bacterium]|nr:hypothetical protein [Bacteriovoracaceae bacterium]